MKPLEIVLSRKGRDWWGGGEDNLTNVQCKSIKNWHNESPLHNEYMLITKKESLEPGACGSPL
jgi:hypothetical protein